MSYTTIIYIITGLISVAIAVWLANMARLSGQAKIGIDEKAHKLNNEADEELNKDLSVCEALGQDFFKEINNLLDPREQSKEITKKISNIFTKELEKRVNLNTHELNKEYEAIIEQKSYDQEIAWKKYKKVSTDKKKTEAIIRSIAEGLVVVDNEGKVIMINPAAEKLLGGTMQDKVGKPVSEGIRQEQLISLSRDSADKDDKEIDLVSSQDETRKILRASSAVIENENGETVGMVSVLSDITKQKELDRLKANFVSSVSHELRTPLVAIDKSIELILSKSTGEISETQERFLSIAARNLKRLTTLVNDLLDLSKLEAGKMQLKCLPSSIANVINESVESFNTWAKTKSVDIEKKIQDGLPQVNIDPDRIIQVLNNLIGNAIKFTFENGKIIVEAVLYKEEQEVEVSVADNGIGISKDDLPRIFDKFFQVGERVSTDLNGTGIGLSIVKEIVELHGGTIWVESQKGVGAKFSFRLPLRDNPA